MFFLKKGEEVEVESRWLANKPEMI